MGKVKKILSNYPNYNTRRNLRRSITDFFKAVYGEAKRKQIDEIADRYFSEERDHEQDVEALLKHLNGQAPLTVKLKVSNVKTFLLENDVELPQKFWKKINRRIKGSRALTLDKVPSNKELRNIISHMPIHGKALSLLLSSSGIRIGEALKLNIDDLLLEENLVRIQIRGEITKTGNSRYAFASKEAKETILEWLKVRENYLEAAIAKSHKHSKNMDDPRLFPFGSSTVYMLWNGALEKTRLNGKDKSTGREKIHPHVLRKFFRTRLGAVIPVDVVEALMGHEGYLTEVYRRYTVEDLAKFYLQGESALLVFTEAGEVTKLRKEVEERNKNLNDLIVTLSAKSERLEAENLEMKSKVAKVELENSDMKKRIQKTEEKLNGIMELLQESLKQSGN